jgi:hypothetical protein
MQKGLGMKRVFDHGEELALELHYEPEVDPQAWCSCLVALYSWHLDTSEHIWIHLINSLDLCRTVWSASQCTCEKKGHEWITLWRRRKVAQELSVSTKSIRSAYWRGDIPPIASAQCDQRVEDCTTMLSATAGGSRRRAQQNAPVR